jgi:hypothetical protein
MQALDFKDFCKPGIPQDNEYGAWDNLESPEYELFFDHYFKYSHSPTYIRVAFRGTLRKTNFAQAKFYARRNLRKSEFP